MSSDNKNSGASTLATTAKATAGAGNAGAGSRWLARTLYEKAGRPPIRLLLWDGTEIRGPDPVATVHIHSRAALLRLLLHPDLYFGEAFMHGDLEVEGDLVRFLESLYRARATAQEARLSRVAQSTLSRARRNTLNGSRNNIQHHYDLGNDFYELWLDRAAMQYTCAYFPRAEATLEEAQVAKLDHVCRKLRLQPGETVVEAGCGWGGLARHMARKYGVHVRAYNISHEQVAFARERARAEGLDDRVQYIEDDYRTIDGACDAFVSIGMLEHVGLENYPALSQAIDRVLKPNGRGLIHSIGRNRATGPMNPWIEKRIFPGAYPPSLREMLEIFEHGDFSVLDVENLRLHYAETLRHWLLRFEQHVETIGRRFDADFVRAWRLYLAGSLAAFSSGTLQLFQVVFNRARSDDLPRTRAHLYVETAEHLP